MRDTAKLGVCALSIVGLFAVLAVAQGGLVADAGPDQSGVFVGSTVNLSGAGSVGATTYAWAFTQRPSGSAAVLSNPTTVTPSFIPDRRGTYTVRLTVGNGSSFASDTVVITTANRPPVATAGPDLTGDVGDVATLSGAGSSDPDADKITYRWTVVSAPPTSLGLLAKATKSKASLTLDRPGTYVVELVVKDGQLSSNPDQVVVTTSNSPPVARAGPDRLVGTGAPVQLDGTASSDIDEDSLTYSWTLKRPSGSTAALNDPTSPLPSFVPDRAGSYTATLTVNDGTATAKDAIVLTTNGNRPPVTRAGPDERPLQVGETLQLDGSESTDANGELLSYAWTVTKHPSGSTAALTGSSTPRPTFTADKKGNYTFSLLTTDPGASSASDTRVFAAALPQADAGPDQVVTVGATARLDGSASSHFDGTLAYGWALISMPSGSTATLDNPADPQPRFVADLAGLYVAQLIVFDGIRLSGADTTVVSTSANLAPHADLGPDWLVDLGVPVVVDATATDPNSDPLSFSWALLSRPPGSAAALSALTGTPVQLTPDVAGDYIVQLIATDPSGLASVDTLLLTTGNTAPAVDVGADRVVAIDTPVSLNAMADDPDGGAVSYDWRLLSAPFDSTADLVNPSTDSPTFTPDVIGAYVVQVVVRDAMNVYAIDALVLRAGAGAPVTLSLTPKAVSVPSGGFAQLTVNASAAVTSDLLVQLVSSAPALLAVPANVTIPAGQMSANFNANAGPGNGGAIVTASAGASTAKATVAVGARLVEWTDDASGLWSDATKWTDDIAPGNGDVVVIDRPAGNFVITVDSTTAAIASLHATEQLIVPGSLVVAGTAAIDGGVSLSGSLAGAGTIALGSAMAWDSGTVSLGGGLEILGGQTLTFASNGVTRVLTATSLRNHGTVAMGNGNALSLTGGGTVGVTNAADGLWTMQDSTMTSNGAGTLTFANAGTLRKTAGAGTLRLGGFVAYTNTGMVDVQTGQMQVAGDGASATLTNSGQVAVSGGATVFLDRVTFENGTGFNGAGTLSMNGTTTVTADLTLTNPVELGARGVLTGTGTVHLAAPMTWQPLSVVSLSGGLEVLSGQTLTFPPSEYPHTLTDSSLRNHGTVNGGWLILAGNVALTNHADGLWTNPSIGGSGLGTFANAGVVRTTGAVFGGNLSYTNTGTIEVQSGAFSLGPGSGLLNSGQLAVTAGATFYLDRVTLAAGTTFAGAGLLRMNGMTTVTADLTLTNPVTLEARGVLTGTGTVHLAAPMTWDTLSLVSLSGGLEVLSGQTLTIPSSEYWRTLTDSSLRNHGTVAMDGGRIILTGSGAAIVNESDGLWTLTAGGSSINATGPPPVPGGYSFANAGTLQGPGVLTTTLTIGSGVTYSNTGTVSGVNVVIQP